MDPSIHPGWGRELGEGNAEDFSFISAHFMPILARFSPTSAMFQHILAHFSTFQPYFSPLQHISAPFQPYFAPSQGRDAQRWRCRSVTGSILLAQGCRTPPPHGAILRDH